MLTDITQAIFDLTDDKNDFEKLALEVFRYQAKENKVYREYIELVNINPEKVNTITEIPFLPIDLFKTRSIITGSNKPIREFHSSGTTSDQKSVHYVVNDKLYLKSCMECFARFFEPVNDYCILALLPDNLEQKNSSLVFMMDHFIKVSNHEHSGFYLHNFDELYEKLELLCKTDQKILLFGVSYALLDFAEKFKTNLKKLSTDHLMVMETGGMKGRREEITRTELHHQLMEAFKVDHVCSEYGMTELLSQAYSKGNGLFYSPPWMKISIRDMNDPVSLLETNHTGAMNIIDLANIYSCSFIATNDLGKLHKDGSFEVLGRMDNNDLRGCNLMIDGKELM